MYNMQIVEDIWKSNTGTVYILGVDAATTEEEVIKEVSQKMNVDQDKMQVKSLNQ